VQARRAVGVANHLPGDDGLREGEAGRLHTTERTAEG
jgi:hypothetical protein